MIPIILAGGSGTRFWPLSRRDEPKQLLSLFGDGRTMIQATADRLRPLAGEDQPIYVVCRPDLVEPTQQAMADAEGLTFIEEPAARDTAPAIALATAVAEARYGDEPLAFFPADHFIAGQKSFGRCLQFAAERARQGAIITLGIPPTRPETGYGYIECEAPVAEFDAQLRCEPVKAFVEKPDRPRALQYLEAERYLWNSGIFVFLPSTLWRELQTQQAPMWDQIKRIRQALKDGQSPQDQAVTEAFMAMESISIDYAVMEKAAQVEVIPALFRWSDVGHWAALDEVMDGDDAGNVIEANVLIDDVHNSVIFSEDRQRLIAASGLRNMVIVDTPDALLVIPRNRAQNVRDVVRRLKERDFDKLL